MFSRDSCDVWWVDVWWVGWWRQCSCWHWQCVWAAWVWGRAALPCRGEGGKHSTIIQGSYCTHQNVWKLNYWIDCGHMLTKNKHRHHSDPRRCHLHTWLDITTRTRTSRKNLQCVDHGCAVGKIVVCWNREFKNVDRQKKINSFISDIVR